MLNKSPLQASMSTFPLILILFMTTTILLVHGSENRLSENRLISEVLSEFQSPTYFRNSPGLSSDSSGSEERAISRLEVASKILKDQAKQWEEQGIKQYRANYLDISVNLDENENMELGEQLNGLYQKSYTPELGLHYSKTFPDTPDTSSNVKIVWDRGLWAFVNFDVKYEANNSEKHVWYFDLSHTIISVLDDPYALSSPYPIYCGFAYPISKEESGEGRLSLTPLDLYKNHNLHTSTEFETKYLYYKAHMHWNDFHFVDGIAKFDTELQKWRLFPDKNYVIYTEANVLDLKLDVDDAIQRNLNNGIPIKKKMTRPIWVKQEKFILSLLPLIPTYVTTERQTHDVENIKRMMKEIMSQLKPNKVAQERFTLFTKNVDEAENTSLDINMTTQDNSLVAVAEHQEAKVQLEKLELEKKRLQEEIENEKNFKELKETQFQEEKKELEYQLEILKQSMGTEKKEQNVEIERFKNEITTSANLLSEQKEKVQSLEKKLSDLIQKNKNRNSQNETKEKDLKNLQSENAKLLAENKKINSKLGKDEEWKQAHKDKVQAQMNKQIKELQLKHDTELNKKDEEMKKKEEQFENSKKGLLKQFKEDLLIRASSPLKKVEKSFQEVEAGGASLRPKPTTEDSRKIPFLEEVRADANAMLANDEGRDDEESGEESSHEKDKNIDFSDEELFLQWFNSLPEFEPVITVLASFFDQFDD